MQPTTYDREEESVKEKMNFLMSFLLIACRCDCGEEDIATYG